MIVYKNEITSAYCCGYPVTRIVACGETVWEKQEPPTPPQPTGSTKWGYLDWSGNTHNFPCDGSSTLTHDEISDALDEIYESGTLKNYYIHSAWVGDCVTRLDINAFNAFFDMSAITLSSSVTSMDYCSFKNTDIRSIVIPSGVTTISDSLCNLCPSLSSVTLHNGITSIGIDSFADCPNLLDITIPSSVTSIGDSAFYLANSQENANALANRRVTILATIPPTIPYANVFGDNLHATYKIYVPAESLQVFKTAEHWDYIANRINPII